MGRKKKRAAPNPRERIFCYYCDRTFNTEQELLMHQREKHLRCPTCNKRMLSIPSLTIHSEQMHNTTVASVPNAIQGRTSTHVDVLGMKGIPEEYYLALEGKSSKKTNYENTGYQAYPPQHAYPQSQGYSASGYPPQGYAAQTYNHGYQQQFPLQYSAQQYPAHNYSPQGYAFPLQQEYTSPVYPTHPSTYPQQPYGPQQPLAQSQPLQSPQYSAQYTTYSQSSSSLPSQTQSNGPRPVPDEQPPSLPSGAKQALAAQPADSTGLPATAGNPTTTTSGGPARTNGDATKTGGGPTSAIDRPSGKPGIQSEPGITVIFDRIDLCMEELRAQLPQYRVSAPKP